MEENVLSKIQAAFIALWVSEWVSESLHGPECMYVYVKASTHMCMCVCLCLCLGVPLHAYVWA